MALFKKRKDDIKQKIKPPMFPGLPEHNFPTYEPTFPSSLDNIKRAVQDFDHEERPLAIPEEKAIFVKVEKYKEAIDAHLTAIGLAPEWQFPRRRIEYCLSMSKDKQLRFDVEQKLKQIEIEKGIPISGSQEACSLPLRREIKKI